MVSKSSPDRDDVDDPLCGRVLGERYRLDRRLGRGGMGSVYAAHDVVRDESCAVKLITGIDRKDDELNRRLEREATAVRAIDSAYVVRHRDSGVDGDVRFLVMDRVDGEDLGERLARDGRLPVAEVLAIAAAVLRGLRAAHVAGVLHRDLKPDNVMILSTPPDDGVRLKIVDFGVSKLRKPSGTTGGLALTRDGAAVGTPFYMAPEQAQGHEIDERVDLYGLGALLFECLAGRPPHVGESYEQVIVAICTKDAVDVSAIEPTVPPAVSKFVARALARDRDKRFASASHMLRALLLIAPEERRPEDDTLAATPAEVEVVVGATRQRVSKESTSATDHAVVRPSNPISKGPSVITLAGVAALLGAGVTATAIGVFGKSPTPVVGAPTTTLAVAASSSPAIASAASASASPEDPPESSSPAPRDAGRALAPATTPSSSAKPPSPIVLAAPDAGAKDLELLRKLP